MGGSQQSLHPCTKSIPHTHFPHNIQQESTINGVIGLGKIQQGCNKLTINRQALSQQLECQDVGTATPALQKGRL
jgi:hypothetical protein